MERSHRYFRPILIALAGVALIYAFLPIPEHDASLSSISSDRVEKRPFAWNQDDYRNSLGGRCEREKGRELMFLLVTNVQLRHGVLAHSRLHSPNGAGYAFRTKSPKFFSILRPVSWLFSGWNCVATMLSFQTIDVKVIP